jgi:hypothetical protein
LIHLPGIGEDPFKPGFTEDPLKEADGMVRRPGPAAPLFQKGSEIVGGGIGSVKLHKGRLDQIADSAPGKIALHLCSSRNRKEGHCCPVDRNTSVEGRCLLFMPKTTQDRGKAGSQVTLK